MSSFALVPVDFRSHYNDANHLMININQMTQTAMQLHREAELSKSGRIHEAEGPSWTQLETLKTYENPIPTTRHRFRGPFLKVLVAQVVAWPRGFSQHCNLRPRKPRGELLCNVGAVGSVYMPELKVGHIVQPISSK